MGLREKVVQKWSWLIDPLTRPQQHEIVQTLHLVLEELMVRYQVPPLTEPARDTQPESAEWRGRPWSIVVLSPTLPSLDPIMSSWDTRQVAGYYALVDACRDYDCYIRRTSACQGLVVLAIHPQLPARVLLTRCPGPIDHATLALAVASEMVISDVVINQAVHSLYSPSGELLPDDDQVDDAREGPPCHTS